MKTELLDRKPVEATVRVTLPASDVDAAYAAVVTPAGRTVRVPGFRPGRAPAGVIVKRVGQEAINDEVKDRLIDESFKAALEEHDLLPVSTHFHAHAPVQGAEYSFEIHSELYPEVTLPDLGSITIESPTRELTDDLVAEAIEDLRTEHATLVPVDRPVEPTDWLLIEATSLPRDGEEAGSEAAGASRDGQAGGGDEAEPAEAAGEPGDPDTAPPSTPFPVDLERADPELRDQLTGATAGEERVVTLTDDTERGEDDAPTVRRMRVKVVDVKAKDKPEAGQELATHLGMESWEAVEQRVRESIAEDLARENHSARRSELIGKLVEGASLELPPGMVRRRQQTLLENLVADLRERGQTLEAYVARLDETGKREEFEQELADAAAAGVRRDLVLERLTEVRGTEVPASELTAALKHLATQRRQDVGAFVRDMGEDWVANYRYLLTRDQAVRDLLAELTGEPVAGVEPATVAAEQAADAAGEGSDGPVDDPG